MCTLIAIQHTPHGLTHVMHAMIIWVCCIMMQAREPYQQFPVLFPLIMLIISVHELPCVQTKCVFGRIVRIQKRASSICFGSVISLSNFGQIFRAGLKLNLIMSKEWVLFGNYTYKDYVFNNIILILKCCIYKSRINTERPSFKFGRNNLTNFHLKKNIMFQVDQQHHILDTRWQRSK